jgi:hypothetical protein
MEPNAGHVPFIKLSSISKVNIDVSLLTPIAKTTLISFVLSVLNHTHCQNSRMD